MRQWLAVAAVLAGAAWVTIACQTESPDAPGSVAGPTGNGAVTAMATPTPAPSPAFPGNVPLPTNPDQGQLPTQPIPVPIEGNPSPQPSSSPGGGQPGGGGGGPSPSPSPSPSPTPTPTPTPGICPASLVVSSTETPYVTSGGGNGPDLLVPALSQDCAIAAVRTYFRVTSADLAASTRNGEMIISLIMLGRVIADGLIDLSVTTRQPLTGTQMGTSCTDLRFEEGGPPFSTAAPPYVGTFAPYGDRTVPNGTGNFNNYEGELASGSSWSLGFYRLDAAVTVECWTLELDLVRIPTPLKQGEK